MAGGNAIRGSRVGAGPMGEAERGEVAPRVHISFWCSNGHETRPSFAEEPGLAIPEQWDCPRCGLPGRARQGQPPGGAEGRALQDAPRVREGAPLRRGRRGHPRRGAADAARPRPHPVGPARTLAAGRVRREVTDDAGDPAALARPSSARRRASGSPPACRGVAARRRGRCRTGRC